MRTREERIAAFWARVQRDAPDACWLWTGARNGAGYGQYAWPGLSTRLAHRIAYWLTHGEWPFVVMHQCDTPPCVNPRHLHAGTHTENMADKVRKRRHSHGARHPHAKLTDADAMAIREAYAGGALQHDLAKQFGVSQPTIAALVRGRGWRHVLPTSSETFGPQPRWRKPMPGRSTGAEDHLRAIQQALHTDARGEVLVAVAARMWQIVQCVNVWLSLSRPRGDQANATLVSDEAHCVEPLDAPRAVVLTRWVETPDEDADAD